MMFLIKIDSSWVLKSFLQFVYREMVFYNVEYLIINLESLSCFYVTKLR